MGWHTSAVLINVDRPKDVPAFLEQLGFADAVFLESVDFEEATSSGFSRDSLTVAVAAVDGWTALWGPMIVADAEALLKASEQGPVFTLIMEGASSTYGFEVYREGSKVRGRLEQAGAIIHDEGSPLPEEAESPDGVLHQESHIFQLMEKVAIPFDRLSAVEYDLYELPFG